MKKSNYSNLAGILFLSLFLIPIFIRQGGNNSSSLQQRQRFNDNARVKFLRFYNKLSPTERQKWVKEYQKISAAYKRCHYPTSLAFHPSGDLLASGLPDGSLLIWNKQNGKFSIKQHLICNYAPVIAISFSQNGSKMLTVSEDSTIYYWIRKNDRYILNHVYYRHRYVINTITFCPGDKSFMTGGIDGHIVQWIKKENSFRPAESMGSPDNFVTHIQFSKDGSRLIAVLGRDIAIFPFLKERFFRPNILTGKNGIINSLDMNSRGTLLAAGSKDGILTIYRRNRHSYSLIQTTITAIGPITALKFIDRGEKLACGSEKNLLLFTRKQQQFKPVLNKKATIMPATLAINKNDQFFTYAAGGKLYIEDRKTGKIQTSKLYNKQLLISMK